MLLPFYFCFQLFIVKKKIKIKKEVPVNSIIATNVTFFLLLPCVILFQQQKSPKNTQYTYLRDNFKFLLCVNLFIFFSIFKTIAHI